MNRVIFYSYLVCAILFQNMSFGMESEVEQKTQVYDVGIVNARGSRHNLEDTYIAQQFPSMFSKDRTNHCDRIFAVFDGHGGPEVAQLLAKNFPLVLAAQMGPHKDVSNLEGIVMNSLEMFDNSSREFSKQGSTIAMALIVDQKIYVANLGDSRVVTVKYEDETYMNYPTVDHKPKQEEEARILCEGGFIIKKGKTEGGKEIARVAGILAMSRSIGDYRAGEKIKGISIKPSWSAFDLDSSVQFIIIATDGLWDVFTSSLAVNYVVDLRRRNYSAERVAQELLSEAKKKRSSDDITIVLVFF